VTPASRAVKAAARGGLTAFQDALGRANTCRTAAGMMVNRAAYRARADHSDAGLITREIPLKGDLDKDIQDATSAARQIECRDGRPIPARTAACRGFGRIFVIAAAGSVGVGAVPANPDPHDGLNVDTAAFRATHVEKVGHG
jgi:hypothetical protein